MSVSEIQETAATLTGTWATQSSSAYSGGTRIASSTAGATATFAVSGRACYLLTSTQEAGGQFTVTVDGAAAAPGTCFGIGQNDRNRVLIPLFRNLTDGAHTVVITAVGTAPVLIDSLLVVTGAAIAPVAGNLVALGDSITAGYGLANVVSAWPARLGYLLGYKLGRPFTLFNKGISGDSLFCVDSGHVGGMYRLFSDVVPNAPEVLTIMFGVNDMMLNQQPSGEYAANLLRALEFVEDVFAVAQMAVVVCTPSYLAPAALLCAPSGNQSGYYAGTPSEHYRLALELVKTIVSLFSWASVAFVYETMDDADSMVYPNGGFDSTHPGDGGHGVISVEVLRATIARFAAIGKA
jgi:lysophospholipase L1-like esterase